MRPNSKQSRFKPFTYKSLENLRNEIERLELNIPINPEVEILQQRIKFRNGFIPNRLAIQPMEGFDSTADGTPSDLSFRRYRRYAEGGAGLIWFEATAISKDGRSNEHQFMLSEQNLSSFKELVSKTRQICNQTLRSLGFKDECLLILQLNHSGRYSKKGGKRFPIRAYQCVELDSAINVTTNDGKIISDEELSDLEDIWVNKVMLARDVGFDGVDIKACHGYLIGELLTARNRQNSIYGGESLENRSRFLLNVYEKWEKKKLKNDDFFLTTRLGIYDGMPYPLGFGNKKKKDDEYPASMDLKEPIDVLKNLYDKGLRLVNISSGDPHYKAHITRPYDTPLKGKEKPQEHPLYGVHRMINLTSEIKKKMPKDLVIIGSGYSYLRQFAGHIAAGLIHEDMVDICGFGRMAFANPSFPKQISLNGIIDKKMTCITCSQCSGLMREGKSTGCVIRDSYYKN